MIQTVPCYDTNGTCYDTNGTRYDTNGTLASGEARHNAGLRHFLKSVYYCILYILCIAYARSKSRAVIRPKRNKSERKCLIVRRVRFFEPDTQKTLRRVGFTEKLLRFQVSCGAKKNPQRQKKANRQHSGRSAGFFFSKSSDYGWAVLGSSAGCTF